MSKRKNDPNFSVQGGVKVPTNHYTTTRPYCVKHSRAMLDIGGEKRCTACIQEQRKTEASR